MAAFSPVETSLLSVPEAAQLLGVSPKRLHHAIRLGQVRGVPIGGRTCVSRAVIEELVAANPRLPLPCEGD